MTLRQLQEILSHYPFNAGIHSFSVIGAGHIHESIWVNTVGEDAFVLQRINNHIFPDSERLGHNLDIVSRCMQAWAAKHYPHEHERRFIQFIPPTTGGHYLQAQDGNWRLMVAIQDSLTYEVVETSAQAYEAGRLFGEFWMALSVLSPQQIKPTIHRFHDLRWRWEQLQEAYVASDDAKRVRAAYWVAHTENLWHHVAPTIEAIESRTLPLHIVHNDAKLSNALFDKDTKKGLCVIDLDTVMPGYLLYDFGDMVRSMCCPVAEDSLQLELVRCDIQRFEALAKGYLEASASHITKQEVQSLVQAGTYMSLIMGMRFLADFLQKNIYYKTTYPDHNLDRARNQITLALDLKGQEKQLHSVLQSFLS